MREERGRERGEKEALLGSFAEAEWNFVFSQVSYHWSLILISCTNCWQIRSQNSRQIYWNLLLQCLKTMFFILEFLSHVSNFSFEFINLEISETKCFIVASIYYVSFKKTHQDSKKMAYPYSALLNMSTILLLEINFFQFIDKPCIRDFSLKP